MKLVCILCCIAIYKKTLDGKKITRVVVKPKARLYHLLLVTRDLGSNGDCGARGWGIGILSDFSSFLLII